MLKTLLLNSSYETISFISLRSLIKLIVKGKVDLLSFWDNEELTWGSGKSKYPSIVRLKYYVKRSPVKTRFNRRGILKRDMYQCQYCGIVLPPAQLTIDHLLPKSQGGRNSWDNCCAACLACNSKKGDRTPEQAKMSLLKPITIPQRTLVTEYILIKPKHADWQVYFADVVEIVEQFAQHK